MREVTQADDLGEFRMTTEKTKKPKAHPWRAFNPGWLSDKGCGDRVVPLRARPIR